MANYRVTPKLLERFPALNAAKKHFLKDPHSGEMFINEDDLEALPELKALPSKEVWGEKIIGAPFQHLWKCKNIPMKGGLEVFERNIVVTEDLPWAISQKTAPPDLIVVLNRSKALQGQEGRKYAELRHPLQGQYSYTAETITDFPYGSRPLLDRRKQVVGYITEGMVFFNGYSYDGLYNYLIGSLVDSHDKVGKVGAVKFEVNDTAIKEKVAASQKAIEEAQRGLALHKTALQTHQAAYATAQLELEAAQSAGKEVESATTYLKKGKGFIGGVLKTAKGKLKYEINGYGHMRIGPVSGKPKEIWFEAGPGAAVMFLWMIVRGYPMDPDVEAMLSATAKDVDPPTPEVTDGVRSTAGEL